MKKQVLALLTALVAMLCLVTVASAAEGDIILNRAEVFFDEPVPGKAIPKIRVPEGAHYSVTEYVWDDQFSDAVNPAVLADKTRYSVRITLEAHEGYAFSTERLTVFINGEQQGSVWHEGKTLPLYYEQVFQTVLYEAEVLYDAPAPGPAPEIRAPKGANYTLSNSCWYDLDAGEKVTVLEEGGRYQVFTYLIPADGYAFAKNVKTLANGKETPPSNYMSNWGRIPLNAYESLCMSVEEVTASYAAPVAGKPAPAVTLPENAPYVLESVEWFDWNNMTSDPSNRMMGDGSFEIRLQLRVKDGYAFSDAVKISVNGETAEIQLKDPMTVYAVANFTFAEKIHVIEVLYDEPTAPCAVPKVTVPKGAPYTLTAAIWSDATNGVEQVTEMKAGLQYELYVQLEAKEDYEFAKDAVILFNGRSAKTATIGRTLAQGVGDCKDPVPDVKITTKADSGKPTLTWKAIPGAAKYEVYRATSSTGSYSKMSTTTNTNYTNTTAVAGKTYYYKVRAVDANGELGEFSVVKSITCDLPAPANLKISTKADTGKPTLTWDKVDGAVKYEIWRATSQNGTYTKMYTQTSTSYTNTSAEPNRQYYYKVKALASSSYADSALSEAKTVVCDCAQPVTSLTVKTDSGKPYLTWKAVDGAAQYEVYRATSKNGTYTKMYTTSGTSYINSTAKPGTTYYYKVRAIGSSSYATGAYSVVKSITCDCAQPVITLTVKADSGKPYLTWKAVDGATKYEIYRATSKDGTYTKMYTTTGTSYTNTSAKPGTTYYYKVRAIGSTEYANSAYSTIKSVTCDCAAPVVTITTNSAGKPYLTWKAVEGAKQYAIYRSTSANGTYEKMWTTSSTYYTNTSAKSGTTYYYKVVALGSTSYANSAYSNIVSVKCK